MAYLYILKLKTGTHYCGITKDIATRIQNHNKGLSKSTRNGLPIVLKYIWQYSSMKLARVKEKQIKKQGVTRWLHKNVGVELQRINYN